MLFDVERIGEHEILKLTLNDPSSRNAFSLKAARELADLIQPKDFKALILTARGRVFCSGGQLDDYAAMTNGDEGRKVNDEIRDVLESLATLDRPTVAAISGDAFGGGVELISCFDHVIAASHAMMALWQRKIGLSFGWGGGARLERRLGAAALRRLSLSTQAMTAREAQMLGLVDQIAQDHQILTVAQDHARRLIGLPHEPLMTFKNFSGESEAGDFNRLWWNASHQRVLATRRK